MKLPYGCVLNDDEIAIHEEGSGTVHSIFEYYLTGGSLGEIVGISKLYMRLTFQYESAIDTFSTKRVWPLVLSGALLRIRGFEQCSNSYGTPLILIERT